MSVSSMLASGAGCVNSAVPDRRAIRDAESLVGVKVGVKIGIKTLSSKRLEASSDLRADGSSVRVSIRASVLRKAVVPASLDQPIWLGSPVNRGARNLVPIHTGFSRRCLPCAQAVNNHGPETPAWSSNMSLKDISRNPVQTPIRKTLCATLVAALSVSASMSAAAGDYSATQARAEVIGSEPIYRSVEVAVPREVCRDERIEPRYDPRYDRRYSNSGRRSNTPGIVGAIIGGALGHAVGNGNKNKKIGTAVGAVLGGSIGGDISRRNHQRSQERNAERGYRNDRPVSYRTERVCYEEIDYRTEEQISGYDVTYVYAGETYTTVLAEACLLYTSPSPRDQRGSRMPSSA